MIEKIKIIYPKFGKWLNIEKEFNKWINIIDEDNWYGKTTILNTIMSIFTGSYPWLRSLPEGTAEVKLTDSNVILSKKSWIGKTTEVNDLYKYCMPWEFFNGLSTVEQRKSLVDLLWLDYNMYMRDSLAKLEKEFTYLVYSDNLEKELNAKKKEFENNEWLLLEDIARYKSQLINFDEKTFEDVDLFYANSKILNDKVKEYNLSINSKMSDLNKLKASSRDIDSSIVVYKNKIETLNDSETHYHYDLETLRQDWLELDANWVCDSCWTPLIKEAKQNSLDAISKEADDVKLKIDAIPNKVKETTDIISNLTKEKADIDLEITNTPEPKVLWYDDIKSNAKLLWVDIPSINEDRLKEYDEYKDSLVVRKQVQDELKFKEDKLKTIDTLNLQLNIDKLKEVKWTFTSKLEEATESLPLDIELFKTQKNGTLKETFSVNHNWTAYKDLSTWNKMIVNILLAKLFIDKLWLDFILIDEAASIWKVNAKYIKELSKDYQVILARASRITLADFK